MRNTNKKGFTIVELVIVVAVIAILAAVLIPTFSGIIRKANESKDNQLIKNLNTAIAADVDGDKTMAAAIAAAAEFGFDLAKIDAKVEGNEILWDSVANVFCYLNEGTVEYLGEVANKGTGAQLWIIDTDGNTETHDEYSSYVANVEAGKTVVANHSIDVTACEGVNVEYKGANNVDIYTNGGVLTVDAPSATVNHYGDAAEVYVNAVSENTFNLYAKVGYLEVAAGQHVVLKSGSKANAIFADTTSNVEVKNGQSDSIVVTSGDKEAVKTGATLFAGGRGTDAAPYLIENAEQLMNITLNYDKGYAYYKVADGIETIDCSIIPNKCISLNGSFDGNNAKFINLAYQLFAVVGYQNKADNITIANIDATFNAVEGGAFVRNLINGGTTTFNNVKIHGYLEGSSNMGCFYKYGTAQYGTGASYTVNFVNSQADATIVDISGNTVGGLIGHPFHGAGNTVTINIDENSGYFGAQYSTSGKGYNLAAINKTGGASVILNGTEGYADPVISVNKIDIVKAEKDENGIWTIAQQNNVSSMVVSIFAQYTEYNADGTPKVNAGGLTAVVGSKTITDLSASTKVLDKVDSVEIVNEYINGGMGYTLENGVLKVFVGPKNALSGSAKLQVAQYDANGNVVATGSVILGEVTKK